MTCGMLSTQVSSVLPTLASRLLSLPSLPQPGIRLHFVEMGSGPAVCLCHGFPESWFSWRYQVKETEGGAPHLGKERGHLDAVA